MTGYSGDAAAAVASLGREIWNGWRENLTLIEAHSKGQRERETEKKSREMVVLHLQQHKN